MVYFVADINELAAQSLEKECCYLEYVNELLAWPVAICSSV